MAVAVERERIAVLRSDDPDVPRTDRCDIRDVVLRVVRDRFRVPPGTVAEGRQASRRLRGCATTPTVSTTVARSDPRILLIDTPSGRPYSGPFHHAMDEGRR
jgi:hypothetical protein